MKTQLNLIGKLGLSLLILLCALLHFNGTLHATNRLYVLDPQMWWSQTGGVIREAKLVVTPAGTYVNYDLYLTISAIDGYYTQEDTLEFVLDFELPDRSIVHDSWLWFEDTLLIAEIMDRWTANAIYESIVQRNQDPSILFKQSDIQYQLRVFPMAGHESRSLRLSWLQPINWSYGSVSVDIPLHILQTSASNYPNLEIYIDSDWGEPYFHSLPEKTFTLTSNPDFQKMLHSTITDSEYANAYTISFQTPMSDGVFLSTYSSEEENLYQLVMIPSHALDIAKPSKVLVMIDYDENKTSLSYEHVLLAVKQNLQENFTEKDSFNLILSGLNPYQVSSHWMPSHQDTVERVFSELPSSAFSSNTYLSQLLVSGLNLMKMQLNEGALVLVAASDAYGRSSAANNLMKDIKSEYSALPTVHVVDFNNHNISSFWQGGGYYYGNEYLYTLLTRQTGGNYYTLAGGGSMYSTLGKAFQSVGYPLSIYDLHVTLDDGFCYGRINPTPVVQTTYANRPILQMGKYYGSPPFQIQFSGLYNQQPFSRTIQIDTSYHSAHDSLLMKIWTGNFIIDLERNGSTNDIISEVVKYSLEYRILSLYTAFLALEPGVSTDIPSELERTPDWINDGEWWEDGGWEPIGIDDDVFSEVKSSELDVAVYPNPFSYSTTIQVIISDFSNTLDYSISIHNILGEKIKSFNPQQYQVGNKIVIKWDGRHENGNEIPAGNYLLVVRVGNDIKTVLISKQ